VSDTLTLVIKALQSSISDVIFETGTSDCHGNLFHVNVNHIKK
jgi:hypothetical protein